MGLLQPRTTSVSLTTYIATTVVLVLWLLAAIAVAIYLFIYQRRRTQRAQSTPGPSSYDNTTPRSRPNDLAPLSSSPPRARTQSQPPEGTSSLLATMRPAEFSPVPTPPGADIVPLGVPTKSQGSGRMVTVSPTRNPLPAPPSANDETPRAILAKSPAQAAKPPRLQAMALASDTTDVSAETAEPAREVVNAGYLAMLARSGVPLRDHALLGSDDSTDAGGGTAAASSYAMHARARGSSGRSVDHGIDRGRYTGRGGRTRAVTFGQRNGDEELERMQPSQVRKMSSI